MTLRKPFTVKTLELDEADAINQNFDRAYGAKVEALKYRQISGVTSYVYQFTEGGEANFSANGSPTTAQTFALAQKFNRVLDVYAHAKSVLVSAHVTDVTSTSITIETRTISGTANFSGVTTAAIRVNWRVFGTDA